MTLGDIVKNYRLENNYSMDDFSKISGLSKGYISMLEKNKNPRNGKPISPSLTTIKQIATALRIDFDDLIKIIDSKQTINLNDDNISSQIKELDNNKSFLESENPDIRMIARAGKKMTPEQAENLRKYAEFMFPEAFEE